MPCLGTLHLLGFEVIDHWLAQEFSLSRSASLPCFPLKPKFVRAEVVFITELIPIRKRDGDGVQLCLTPVIKWKDIIE